MTTEHWLTVAVIITAIITAIATLLGPALAVLVHARISQPKPSPDANKPKTLVERIKTWFGGENMPIVGAVIMIVLCISALVLEMLQTAAVNRWDVLQIAFFTSVIGLGLVFIIFMKVISMLDRIVTRVSWRRKK
jgi:hypothetical protein